MNERYFTDWDGTPVAVESGYSEDGPCCLDVLPGL